MRAHSDFMAPDRPLVTRMKAPIPDINLNLPPNTYDEFPKMALKIATKEDIEWFQSQHENYDERVGKMRYTARPPKLGALIALRDPDSQQVVVFQDEDEERAFYEAHPEIVPVKIAGGRAHPDISDSDMADFQAWKAEQAKKKNALQSASAHLSNEEEKASLLQRAERVGLQPDKRWGLDRLRDEVIKAEGAGI